MNPNTIPHYAWGLLVEKISNEYVQMHSEFSDAILTSSGAMFVPCLTNPQIQLSIILLFLIVQNYK